jgi:PDZ domain-containing protein
MPKKLYEKIQTFIKEYYKVFLIYLLIFLAFTCELPYYISAPGGLINTKDKVETQDNFKMTGSLNMAYVSEIHGTIPTLAWALIDKDWDIEKESQTKATNESVEDKDYRNKMFLKESNDTALLVAYKNSNIKYSIENDKVYITYIDKTAKTDLKIKDQILYIDNQKVNNKEDLFAYTKTKKINDKVTFKVKNENKTFQRTATLINVLNQPKVGAIVTETFDIKSNTPVNFNFKSTESGSSGGLMLTLAIYSNLNKIDLTHGKTIVGTGTIDADGNVGQISGIKYKLLGAVANKGDIFLVPDGDNYKEALKVQKQKNLKIKIIPIKTFKQALNYLENIY